MLTKWDEGAFIDSEWRGHDGDTFNYEREEKKGCKRTREEGQRYIAWMYLKPLQNASTLDFDDRLAYIGWPSAQWSLVQFWLALHAYHSLPFYLSCLLRSFAHRRN